MAVSSAPEKMVAYPGHHSPAADRRPDNFEQRLCDRALYLHPFLTDRLPMNQIKNLQVLLGIAAGMVALFFIFKSAVFLVIALGVCLAGLLSLRLAVLIAGLWMKAANLIGLILNTVLLSLVFFVLLTPLALIRKIAGKSPILLRPTQGETYFHARNHKYDKSDLQDMW
jgi:hypothetical protein